MAKSDHLKHFGDRMFELPYDIRDEHAMALMKRGRSGLNTWGARTIMHDPIFMNSLRLLMQEMRPKTIMEFGTFEGGLTSYMSDMSKVLGLETRIISFDIDGPSAKFPEPIPGAEFHQLDVFHIWQYVTDQHDELRNLEHPMIVIDDIGINTTDLIRALDVYLDSGDYFVSCHTTDEGAFADLAAWAEGFYLIDGYLCDIFGRNFIENPNGFLIKT